MLSQAVSVFLLRTVALSVVLISTGAILLAQQELAHREHFAHEFRDLDVVPPTSKPPMTQESIDQALELYGIEVPSAADLPELDLELEDRGLTTLHGWGKKLTVTIGPAAFTSWGLLGSTLAHELEVHCHQNFFMIRVKDMLGLQGTEQAEREAYMHELTNSSRFHLKIADQMNIKATMDFYYPVVAAGKGSVSAR